MNNTQSSETTSRLAPANFKPLAFARNFRRGKTLAAVLSLLAVVTGPVVTQAASINVPNASFELQSGVGQQFGVNVLIDSWQKAPEPGYWGPVQSNYGIYWIQTTGAFLDNNPYGNRVGAQAAYMLSFPGVSLSQDYDTTDWNDPSPTHDFNATYQTGQSYQLTLGLFGKGMVEGAMLGLSLYYRDGMSNVVTVGSTTVFYSTNAFVIGGPLNFIDYSVNLPAVQAGDAWAGQNIGVKIESIYGDGNGYWDMDNVRLVSVPEPASVTLAVLGLGALVVNARRLRARK